MSLFNKRTNWGTVVGLAVLFILAGCGQPQQTGFVAPQKPLSKAEEGFLKEIEDTPKSSRQSFMNKHRTEVLGYAMGNRAFGERLNTILDVKAKGDSK